MAFPTTGILDDFNRDDEGPPPSANWTTLNIGHEVDANECIPCANNDTCVSAWSASTFGPNCQCYVELDRISAYWMGVLAHMTTLVYETYDGYLVRARTNNTYVQIVRIDNSVLTQLGDDIEAFAWANGDQVGIEIIDDTIKAWGNDGGAGWNEIGSEEDATYAEAGYVGLHTYVTTAGNAEHDGFGGGTIGGAPPAEGGAAYIPYGSWGIQTFTA